MLALIVGVMYLPGMLSGGGGGTVPVAPVAPAPGTGADATNTATGNPVAVPTTDPNAGLPGAPSSGAPSSGAPSLGMAGATAPGTALAKPVVFISQARVDPFQPVYIIPPPAPTPTPPPPPDPQISIPAPAGFENGINLPSIKDPTVRAAVAQPLGIGSPEIPRLDNISAPRNAFPAPRTGTGEGNVGGAPQQSYDKRLAGIIIGDGVRALLELPSGEQRVVQPGDEVEGIRVLSIERFRQGDRTVTRMLVRATPTAHKNTSNSSLPPRRNRQPEAKVDPAVRLVEPLAILAGAVKLGRLTPVKASADYVHLYLNQRAPERVRKSL